MRRGMTGIAFAATLLSVGLAANIGGGSTMAEFSATTANTSSLTAKRIFPGDRVVSAWDLRDAADATESNETQDVAYVDGVFDTTGNWANTFQSTRYYDFEMNSPLPSGLPVSSASFELDFADNDSATGNNVCYYFEVRRTSTQAVLATYGSSGSPIACETVAVITGTSTSIPAVTTTDIANDVTIRVYAKHSGSKPMRVDRANVAITVYGYSRRLFPVVATDASTGTPAALTWGPARAEATAYQSVGNWSNAFAANRYLKFTFPSHMPGSGSLSSVTFNHSYKSATGGDTTSYYFEVYNGASLIGTHGSTTVPQSSNATTSYVTDNVPLAEVDTTTEANNVVIKLYAKNSGSRKSLHDLVALTFNYSLGATGCTDPRSDTVTATADTFIQEDSGGNDNFGTDVLLDIKSAAGAKNRRAMVVFDTLPTAPDGCALTAASLRMNSTATQGTRTFDVYRISASWVETVVTWGTQPGIAGSAASTANGTGWLTWNVLSHVQSWYSSGNNYGFMIKDSAEESATTVTTTLQSRENTNDPELVLTFA